MELDPNAVTPLESLALTVATIGWLDSVVADRDVGDEITTIAKAILTVWNAPAALPAAPTEGAVG